MTSEDAGTAAAAPVEETPKGIKIRPIEEEMKTSYLDYSMSVIVGRALPDVRDGLKPVHRRIIYAMYEAGMTPRNPYKKSARIVGEVLGKYHPHGDSSVYDSIVRMAQDFSLRYTLVDGQGNFGSVDGDSAAAMRYTESRMSKFSVEMIQDIDKETVDFGPNYDGSLQEPLVLPSKLPNLLINGSAGIAVGMATNIPPHNITEVLDGLVKIIDEPDVDLVDIMEDIQGPDFPTGGIICGMGGVRAAYHTGRGKIIVRGRTHYEDLKKRRAIIVTEIPYQVNKTKLLEDIARLVKEKKIDGIADLRDESDREGMRIVIELKRDADEEIVLNLLFKHTSMQTTFGMINIALVDNQPRVLTLLETLHLYLDHRKEVVRRRTEYDLKKAEERAHIVEGLITAVDNIDEVIKIIRSSKSTDEASERLIERFGFSPVQAKAILDMRLAKLTGLEIEALKQEFEELKALIAELKDILGDPERILAIIREELLELKEKYGDQRRTEIDMSFADIELEDLIPVEDVVITVTDKGYIKRIPADTYRQQRRGGKGMKGMTTKEEDVVKDLLVMSTHDYILFFTNKGRVYWKKGYQIPEGGRYSPGRAIRNVLEELEEDEEFNTAIPVSEFDDEHYITFATKRGKIKKTLLTKYSRPRRKGIKAIKIDSDDALLSVVMSNGLKDIFLATKNGQAIKFFEGDVRPMGRNTRGVRGIRLGPKDEGVSLCLVDADLSNEEVEKAMDRLTLAQQKAGVTEDENGDDIIFEEEEEEEFEEDDVDEEEEEGEEEEEEVPGQKLLTVTVNGYGKRTLVERYRKTRRGGKGVRTIICNERNGPVVAVIKVELNHELIITTLNGKVIRIPVNGISLMSRSTQGVRIMKLDEGDRIVALARVDASDEEYEDEEEEMEEEGSPQTPELEPEGDLESEDSEESDDLEESTDSSDSRTGEFDDSSDLQTPELEIVEIEESEDVQTEGEAEKGEEEQPEGANDEELPEEPEE